MPLRQLWRPSRIHLQSAIGRIQGLDNARTRKHIFGVARTGGRRRFDENGLMVQGDELEPLVRPREALGAGLRCLTSSALGYRGRPG